MEEMIKFVVFKNVEEASFMVDSLDGLCYYFANDIKADLEMMEIPVLMYNINDGGGHDHYYLIANDEFLIDPTYSQFMEKPNEKPIMFEDFPGKLLKKTARGKEILIDLLENGYHKLIEGDMDIYLSSFKLKDVKERSK